MSQYGDGDYCEVSDHSVRTARKVHHCHACGEAIRPGDTYGRTFYVFDGDAHTVKRCVRCEAIYNHLSTRMREEGEPEEFCDERLDCGHEYEENWDEPPPEHIAALAFWLPGDPLPSAPTSGQSTDQSAK